MIRPATVALLVALGLLGVGLLVPYLMKLRTRADDARCKHNLRELAWFAADPADPEAKGLPARPLPRVPAGTVALPGVVPADRLSWVPAVLPGVDQKRQNMEPVLAALDRGQPWAAERNQRAARVKLFVVLCPGNPPDLGPDQPAPSSYVGVAGLGADAAAIPLPPGGPVPPRAGAFRYDGPTPFERFADGRGQTLLLGERAGDVGPWLRGGPATVRGLVDAPGAPPPLGPGGQFGGTHPGGANWAFADWSVRFFSDRVDPRVLYGLATIAGGERDPVPGE